MYTRLKEIESVNNVDILFIGSSHSYRGFDPRIFKKLGYKTFNLGSSAQTPIQATYLIENYIEKLNPKLVIVETFPLMFCKDGTESSLDIISNSKLKLKTLKLVFKHNSLIVYNTTIYSFYRDVFYAEKASFMENKIKENDIYINGGFVESKPRYFKDRFYKKQSWKFNKKQFDEFDNLINILRKNNTNYILIQAPLTSALYKSYTNTKEFDEKISQYGKYYNFNELIELIDTLHFYDANHLNQEGVRLFNAEVIKLIQNEM